MSNDNSDTTLPFPANAYYHSPQATAGMPISMAMFVGGFAFGLKAEFFAMWAVVWIAWSAFEWRYWNV